MTVSRKRRDSASSIQERLDIACAVQDVYDEDCVQRCIESIENEVAGKAFDVQFSKLAQSRQVAVEVRTSLREGTQAGYGRFDRSFPTLTERDVCLFFEIQCLLGDVEGSFRQYA